MKKDVLDRYLPWPTSVDPIVRPTCKISEAADVMGHGVFSLRSCRINLKGNFQNLRSSLESYYTRRQMALKRWEMTAVWNLSTDPYSICWNDCPKSCGAKRRTRDLVNLLESPTAKKQQLHLWKPDFHRPPRLPYRSQGAWSLRLMSLGVWDWMGPMGGWHRKFVTSRSVSKFFLSTCGYIQAPGTHFEGIVTHQEAIRWTHQKLEKCIHSAQIQKRPYVFDL